MINYIRCRGRLEYADLPVESKEPVMLPKDHHLTFLQILRCHKKVHHCGVNSTLAELRTNFWVPKGRQVVTKILSQCVTCKKWEGTAFTQPVTASLPEFRVNLAPLFSRVGRFCWTNVCQRTRQAVKEGLCLLILMLCYSGTAFRLGGRSLKSYISEVSEEVHCSKRNSRLDCVG